MRKLVRCCVVACAVLGTPGLAAAQNPASYPDRPIRLVVAFVAGNDVQQRPHAHPLAVRQAASSQHRVIEILGEVHRRGSHELQLLH